MNYDDPTIAYPEHECMECGKPIFKENEYCSHNCWEASTL
jgi:predicted nucleic acid-binding Zn ribbon protein